jgi:Ca2+-binding RTX toxin-like protein
MPGTDGNDLMSGLEGNDNIFGYFGNDDIYGGSGDDFLLGDEDYDHPDSFAGIDMLYGGPGGTTTCAARSVMTRYTAVTATTSSSPTTN